MKGGSSQGGGAQAQISWDGKPASFQKFEQSFDWFLHATKHDDRRYIVARVKPWLTGEAKDLVANWKPEKHDCEDGPQKFLKDLRESKLVRRPLMDANVQFGRYFGISRRHSETVSAMMVREQNAFDDFKAASDRLITEWQARQAAEQAQETMCHRSGPRPRTAWRSS